MNWNIDPRTTLLVEETRNEGLRNSTLTAQISLANSKARRAEQAKAAAEQSAADERRARGSDKRAMAILRDRINEINLENIVLKDKLIEKEKEIQEKDATILDWMQSNEAFKSLARKLSDKTQEEFVNEARKAILELAEKFPDKFGQSQLTMKIKERLAASKEV